MLFSEGRDCMIGQLEQDAQEGLDAYAFRFGSPCPPSCSIRLSDAVPQQRHSLRCSST